MKLKMSFENRAKKALINSICTLLENNPEKNIPKIFKLSKTLAKDSTTQKILADFEKYYEQIPSVKTYVDNSLMGINPQIKRTIFMNLMNKNASSSDNDVKYLPVSAILNSNNTCNLSCLNCNICNNKNNPLTYNDFDKVIKNIHKLEINSVILIGGEPFLLDFMLDIFENNKNIIFVPVTNGTLFTEKNSTRLLKSGNVVPIISLGNNELNVDSNYGNGTYNKIITGMHLLKSKGIPFGTLTAVNSNNLSTVISDEFVDSLIFNGSKFSIYSNSFCSNAPLNSNLTSKERNALNEKINTFRNTKPYFFIDLFNDAKYFSHLLDSDVAGKSSFIFSKMPFETLQSESLEKLLSHSLY
ncbi:radical SAM protein [Clostridium sp. SM-530-WT-3G]|uniref:radical SAM protein n=1 Tax=Clostridium sp. SM-530-WT-3G TaxID=2725303 RepID=UPI00145DA234|nr:radical SAM protein [Clostridium sp. SM-530-WT-3G]NME82851.1 radical SAM protein [Clostridium sp. SM-530-WT-3G]